MKMIRLAALAAAAALTAAAAPPPPEPNRSLYSVHQPVVQRADYVLDLMSSPEGLGASEAARLGSWFDSLGIGYGDRIAVDGGAYADPAARADVAAVAANYGLLLADGAPITAGTVPSGAVRVVVSRMVASVPSCPDWSNKSGGGTTTHSNFGCAINKNIAAMVADPNDLVLGQAGSNSPNRDQGAKAIRIYRDRAPSGASGGLKSEKPGGQ